MNTTEIKKRVKDFRREFGIRKVTADVLTDVLQDQGFTLIEFNPVINDADVHTVVHNLGLEEMIGHSTGFLYVDAKYRLLFLSEKLNTAEGMNVGKHIEEILRKQGKSASWLATQIPCERTNVYNIFKRKSLDVRLLMRISVILQYDFFQELSAEAFPKAK